MFKFDHKVNLDILMFLIENLDDTVLKFFCFFKIN